MKYEAVVGGRFISRPNRFIANVEIDGKPVVCHVKNTGRCKELLIPGAEVYLEQSKNPARKTAFDLIAVKKGDLLINMDSQAPNSAAREWAAAGGLGFVPDVIRPEYRLGDSRYDLCLEDGREKWLVEVKGVTLEQEGVALFPDAPTERGAKHMRGLLAHMAEGYRACALFVIQMQGMKVFRPNEATDPAFARALKEAANAGVWTLAWECSVRPDGMELVKPVPVEL